MSMTVPADASAPVASAAEQQVVGGVGCPGCGGAPTDEELMSRLDEVVAELEQEKGALIPILQAAQGLFGYLPENVLRHLSRRLRVPYSEIAGVVTFYSYFSTKPRGRNVIRVCLGTACYVRGGKAILDEMRKELGVQVGEVTEDRLFSLEIGRCFGACGMAPVVMVNDTVHQRVKPAAVRDIIRLYRNKDAGRDNAHAQAG